LESSGIFEEDPHLHSDSSFDHLPSVASSVGPALESGERVLDISTVPSLASLGLADSSSSHVDQSLPETINDYTTWENNMKRRKLKSSASSSSDSKSTSSLDQMRLSIQSKSLKDTGKRQTFRDDPASPTDDQKITDDGRTAENRASEQAFISLKRLMEDIDIEIFEDQARNLIDEHDLLWDQLTDGDWSRAAEFLVNRKSKDKETRNAKRVYTVVRHSLLVQLGTVLMYLHLLCQLFIVSHLLLFQVQEQYS
jgi:hypothetical protein